MSSPLKPPHYSPADPDHDHRGVAIGLAQAGRANEAHEAFKASARFTDTKESHVNLAVSHMRRGEYVQAAHSFGAAKVRTGSPHSLNENLKVFNNALRDELWLCYRRLATQAATRNVK